MTETQIKIPLPDSQSQMCPLVGWIETVARVLVEDYSRYWLNCISNHLNRDSQLSRTVLWYHVLSLASSQNHLHGLSTVVHNLNQRSCGRGCSPTWIEYLNESWPPLNNRNMNYIIEIELLLLTLAIDKDMMDDKVLCSWWHSWYGYPDRIIWIIFEDFTKNDIILRNIGGRHMTFS